MKLRSALYLTAWKAVYLDTLADSSANATPQVQVALLDVSGTPSVKQVQELFAKTQVGTFLDLSPKLACKLG